MADCQRNVQFWASIRRRRKPVFLVIVFGLGWLLLFETGLRAQDSIDLSRIRSHVESSDSPRELLSVVPELIALLIDSETALSATEVADFIAPKFQTFNCSDEQLKIVTGLYLSLSRVHVESFDEEKQLQVLLDLLQIHGRWHRSRGKNFNTTYAVNAYRIVLELIATGHLEEGLEQLALLLDKGFDEHILIASRQSSIGAALHRQLAQLTLEERYELLKGWTFTDDKVRLVSMITPSGNQPPSVFARVLGERPSADSFPVTSAGLLPDVFSTAWELVSSANQLGRLEELQSELQPRIQTDPNARVYWILLKLVIDDEQNTFSQFANAWPKALQQDSDVVLTIDQLVLAAVAASRPGYRDTAIELLRKIEQTLSSGEPNRLLPFARVTLARAIAARSGDPDSLVSSLADFQFWSPAATTPLVMLEQGVSPSLWGTVESHLVHFAGPFDNQMMLQVPLQGQYRFELEAQPAGNVHWSAMNFESDLEADNISISNEFGHETHIKSFPYFRKRGESGYQRIRLESTSDKRKVVLNGHPVWHGNVSTDASPWLAIRSDGHKLTAFRTLKLTGNPSIPDQVQLLGDHSSQDWSVTLTPQKFGEPLSVFPQEEGGKWKIENGELQHGQTVDPLLSSAQSLLTFRRPVFDREVLRYEFFYSPQSHVVHPAMGRVAFLLDKDGVKLHWITASDIDGTGLRAGNSVIEPLNRRGPRPLPLLEDEWNKVELHLENRTLQISLNGEEVYQREMEAELGTQFSFYHDARNSSVRVKDVSLSGNWSQHRDALLSSDLLELNSDEDAAERIRLTANLLSGRHIWDAALHVHEQAMTLPVEERYQFLKEWVLPTAAHDSVRLHQDYSQTNPPAINGEQSTSLGGKMISPAIDLLDTAIELGTLEELKREVESLDLAGKQGINRLALLTVIEQELDIEKGLDLANELTKQLEDLEHHNYSDHWAEMLFLKRSERNLKMSEFVLDFGYRLVESKIRAGGQGRGPGSWFHDLTSWYHRQKRMIVLERLADTGARVEIKEELKRWIPASRLHASTRGTGHPNMEWKIHNNEIHASQSHNTCYLFYQSPLTGDFDFECDLTGFDYHDAHLLYGGKWTGAHWSRDSFDNGDFLKWNDRIPLETKTSQFGSWIHCRMVVRDQQATLWFNGIKMRTMELGENFSPWLALHSHTFTFPGMRDVHITGSPEIPKIVPLSDNKDLPGWIPYYEEGVNGPDAHWNFQISEANGNVISGKQNPQLEGLFAERMLYFQRPMMEDGEITYEFFYEPGQTIVHPALDRKVFMLTKDGVHTHWLTDGAEERVIDADNMSGQPLQQFPDGLPLNSGDWNELKFILQGRNVSLILNGEIIGTTEISLANQRYFGLFHYADQSDVKVRNVHWSGQWPREIPPVVDQELANQVVPEIERFALDLPDMFYHNFATGMFPPSSFKRYNRTSQNISLNTSEGLMVRFERSGTWGEHNIGPKLAVEGDFDVILKYHGLKFVAEPGHGKIGLQLRCLTADFDNTRWTLSRSFKGNIQDGESQVFDASIEKSPSGEYKWRQVGDDLTDECTAGRLRLIRRGKTMYYLASEGDSDNYRLVASGECSDFPTPFGGIRVRLTWHSPAGGDFIAQAVLDSILVRAEHIHHP